MVFRCELCDEFLPIFQFSHLCPCCYKIRTIVKCYNKDSILKALQEKFIISEEQEEQVKSDDEEFAEEEKKRLEEEFKKRLVKPKDMKEKIYGDDSKDYDKPPNNHSKKNKSK